MIQCQHDGSVRRRLTIDTQFEIRKENEAAMAADYVDAADNCTADPNLRYRRFFINHRINSRWISDLVPSLAAGGAALPPPSS